MLFLHVLLISAFVQAQLPRGTGSIQGKVCEIDSCAPIKGAQVTIELPGSDGARRTVTTDESGIFQFTDLPAGRYDLQPEAAGFRPVAVLPLVRIAEGGRADDIEVFMRPLGSISGRAIDINGLPLAFAHVEALAYQQGMFMQPGFLSPVSAADTDRRGEFRLTGLGSDEYWIRISPPVSEQPADVYPPTYYPSATERESAETIRLDAGAHIDGVEVRLVTRGVTVAGRFMTDDGKPATATAYLVRRTATQPSVFSKAGEQSLATQFAIPAVPPGSYWLYAVTDLDRTLDVINSRLRVASHNSPQWVRTAIEVGEKDLRDVTVRIRPTGSLHVRVRFSDDTASPNIVDLSSFSFQLLAGEATPPVNWNPSPAKIAAGQFDYIHLSEVNCSLGFMSDEWFISKLMLEGHDVTSSGFSAAPGEDRLLEVVISNAGGMLAGRIVDSKGNPVAGGRVVLISSTNTPSAQKVALASDTGEFRIQAIAPGDYVALAFPPEDLSKPMRVTDPHWLADYERFGQHVQIGANVESRVDLITYPEGVDVR